MSDPHFSMTSQFPPTLRVMIRPDSKRIEVKKSIWTCSLCPDLCCSYCSLIVSAAGVCVFFALLTRSDWSLQGNSWWIKITRKSITIIPHLLIWPLFLPLIIPWKINMCLVNEFVYSKKMVGVPVVPQSHPAEEGCGGQIMSIYCN